MKAIVCQKYGPPDVLTLQEVMKPAPKDNEVLVKVQAVSINSWDWDMVRGKPYIVRMWGLLKPKYKIPGADIAGCVEEVGKLVTKFKPGDSVFGDLCEDGWGGLAEYTCVREDALALKPESMSFEQAAAIPQAGLMALQSLRDKGRVKPGQKILINGAGGGVGTFGVQIAKFYGAEVTVVDSGSKLAHVRTLGADHVIDYTQEDFTKNGNHYDLIIDPVSTRSVFDYNRSLNPEGLTVVIGGKMSTLFKNMFRSRWISMVESLQTLQTNKKFTMLAYKPNQGLDAMIDLFNKGKVIPVIDQIFPLKETPEAFRYYAGGKFIGKIVITL